MAQKAITIYTPSSVAAHIYAEDDAQVHRALIGSSSGITLADDLLACVKVNDNTVRLSPGVYSMQGYLLCVVGGTTADLTVDSGTAGVYRHDLLIAEFIRGGGNTADTFRFRILKGAEASAAAAAVDPSLTQNDLCTGGTTRQEALYRLVINGATLDSINRICSFIGNVYQ